MLLFFTCQFIQIKHFVTRRIVIKFHTVCVCMFVCVCVCVCVHACCVYMFVSHVHRVKIKKKLEHMTL